jgi:RNA polymerase sigma-70 factor (sigma-E family)
MADRREFDAFVRATSPSLLRIAHRLTGDWAGAEDLLQTALAKSWRAWPGIRGVPEPYVRRVLVTTYASWWRQRWRSERPTGDLPECGVPDGTDRVDNRDVLSRAVEALPRRQRDVVTLRYYQDLSEVDIAAALRVSPGTVKSSASRALIALRRDAVLAQAVLGEDRAEPYGPAA